MRICLLLALALFFSACTTKNIRRVCSASPNSSIRQGVSWYRMSAEQKALYRQSYAAGSRFVREWVEEHKPSHLSWGVILDIDETVLDNSWYFEECQTTTKTEAEFSKYVSLADKSVVLPGAARFTLLVHELGGYVSLVSNRDGSYRDHRGSVLDITINNLMREGVYFDQVVLANHQSLDRPTDKTPRFKAIEEGVYDAAHMVWSNTLPSHKVIAYFGDNIQDFPGLKQLELSAIHRDDPIFDSFINGFFIMPNPIYGSWQAH